MSDMNTYRKIAHETAEIHREAKGEPWRVRATGPSDGLTAAQARILARELTEAADSADSFNKSDETPSLKGKNLLLIKHGMGVDSHANAFADGTPKRVIRITHSWDDYELLIAVSDGWIKRGKENHSVSQGKGRRVHYELVGYYTLILEGSETDGYMLVSRVSNRAAGK